MSSPVQDVWVNSQKIIYYSLILKWKVESIQKCYFDEVRGSLVVSRRGLSNDDAILALRLQLQQPLIELQMVQEH
jgi:hypothetical protein